MGIDYKQEVKRLDSFVPGENSKFWKPKPGQHKVKSLTELEEAKPYEEEGKEPKAQVKIDLLVDGEEYTWTMAKGVSPASAYGQLCRLGEHKGSLKDAEFMVVVTNDKKKNTYTIVTI